MKKGTHSIAQLRLVYVVTTSFLIILSIYTFIRIKDLIDSSNWVNHTILVTQSLHKISLKVFDAETNMRGYFLTGNKLMLNKKETALTALSLEQQTLYSLIKDNKVQLENFNILNEDIKKKVINLNNINIPSTYLKINPSIIDNTTKVSVAMDSVVAQIEKMYRVETSLLQVRTKKFEQLSYITPVYIVVLFIGAFIILWTSYIRLNTALVDAQYLHNKLAIQDIEKEKKAATLIVANIELAYQNKEKEQKAAELLLANKELAFQNREKERKAAELIIANKVLGFQNKEKEQRATELIIANKELEFQNKEKEQRASELIIANKELAYQNREKERKAKELANANQELYFQNEEKALRAAELVIANKELLSENEIKEQRTMELTRLNDELKVFAQIASHDLQEPLRKIQMFASRILDSDFESLSEKGKTHFNIIEDAATRMRTLIEDLISYSQTNSEERIFEKANLAELVEEVKSDLEHTITEKQATIEIINLGFARVIPFQFRQLMNNLISNALKFAQPGIPPLIIIESETKKGKVLDVGLLPKLEYNHISVSDNGIGFEPAYNKKVFEVFQRLNVKEKYTGTGIGLAIVKKIVENHDGVIKAMGMPNEGARFDIYLPS